MKHPMLRGLLAMAAPCVVLAPACAQGADPVESPKTFIERFDRRFAGEDPKVGATVPDAVGYRVDGSKVTLHELLGPRTVVVSGCLT